MVGLYGRVRPSLGNGEKSLPIAYQVVRDDADIPDVAEVFLRCSDAEREILFSHQHVEALHRTACTGFDFNW